MNKLRRLAISIIEDTEEHVDRCKNQDDKPHKPFDKENWYLIEDKVYDKLKDYLVGAKE